MSPETSWAYPIVLSEIGPYLWTRHGEMWDLNQLIPAGSNFVLTEAVSINNQGQILAIGQTGKAMSKQEHDHSREEEPTRVFLLTR